MNKWNEILLMENEKKEKDSQIDNMFVKCIFYICNSWYKTTKNEKKIVVFILGILIALVMINCAYNIGIDFGECLYYLIY